VLDAASTTTIGRPGAVLEGMPTADCVVFAKGGKVRVVAAGSEDNTEEKPVTLAKTLELGVKVKLIADVLLTGTNVCMGTTMVDIMTDPLYIAVSTVEKGVGVLGTAVVVFWKIVVALTISVVLVVLVKRAAVVLVVVVRGAVTVAFKAGIDTTIELELVRGAVTVVFKAGIDTTIELELETDDDVLTLDDEVELEVTNEEVLVVEGGANAEIGAE